MSETPIADEIRAEADIATRPGQMDRLTDLAARVAWLERGGKTLGELVAFWQNLAVEVTGSQDCIGPDGDGDWAVVTERLMALAPIEADQ